MFIFKKEILQNPEGKSHITFLRTTKRIRQSLATTVTTSSQNWCL